MKQMILAALLSFGYQAASEQVSCNFAGEMGIQNIHLQSGNPGKITVTMTNGTTEELASMKATAGLFNQLHFTQGVESSSFRSTRLVHTQSPTLGKVYLQYACLNRHSDVFCITRGGSAKEAAASFNIGGKVVKFNTRAGRLCDWTLN